MNVSSRFLSGEYVTTAQWMRKFITEHPAYKQDSVVSEKIAYDLVVACDEISNKGRECPELFGTPQSKTSRTLKPNCLTTMNGPIDQPAQHEVEATG